MNSKYLYPLLAALVLPALLLVAGCDRHGHEDHAQMDQVIIETRGLVPVTIATWTRTGGWDVDNLPTLTVGDETDNYGRVSWTVRIFEGGEELDLERVSPGVCGEHSAQYVVDNPQIIHWTEEGVVSVGNEAREIFHCDHIHIYPRAAGTTQLRIALWHVDHVDALTTPISITVQE